LRGALPESNKVGFGFVETAGIVTVTQSPSQAELVLGVGRIAGERGAKSGDRVVVAGSVGVGEALGVKFAAAGLLIGGEAGNEMADRRKGSDGSEGQDEENERRGTGNEFAEVPRHGSYHDIITRDWRE
jgi:hypothetical protein